MSIAWVAASVRARAMARRRLGREGIRRVGSAGSLQAACHQLVDTGYARAAPATDLASAQRAVAEAVLWDVRILAGWMPSGGTPIARAVVAAFERENCWDHLRRLGGRLPPGQPAPEPFELGSLSTAWHRVRATSSLTELRAELSASPWGEMPVDDPAAFRDAMAAAWLRRVADDLPGVEGLAIQAAALQVARSRLLEHREPGERERGDLEALLGSRWLEATTLPDLRTALDPLAGRILQGVESPVRLWSAEAALWQEVADTGMRLLRDPLSSPEVVVGAVAVLAADAFRVRAALADAALGGRGEVLGGVA
ncbi:MAG TPA: hypothetical protein PLP61_15865 [Nocardioides sp.]|uniref:hypothetical protein n=1 Tax=Nocardioides sp. TaxID=35761 RepID=UPI002C4C35F4|nr:hypothetical protein [Nocardioides sp.]HQR28520.1 hypothetical protein [Nocardioides sp.]